MVAAVRIPLIPVAALAVALAGCGSPSRGAPSSGADATVRRAIPQDAGAYTASAAKRAEDPAPRDGMAVPSALTVTVVPNVGYAVGDDLLDHDGLDALLAEVAEHHPFAAIRIVTDVDGTAQLIQPVLDLCERHGLASSSSMYKDPKPGE